VVGIDVSSKMLAAAWGQLKDLANVELIEGRAVEGRAVEGPSMEHSWDVYP
jgi:ubiquinone/menaquinone biosynthesis C-methylase UbiE